MSETHFDIKPIIFALGTVIGLLFCILVLNPVHKQNVEKIGKNLYKFQDTLEFRDKDSDKIIKRLDNIEFRALDKSRFIYMVKLPDQSSEVLIFEDCPPNSYLRYYETP
jgi:hypothetical protein